MALQLLILIWVAKLESDADRQLSQSINAEKISEAINRLSSDVFDFAASYTDEDYVSIQKTAVPYEILQGKVTEHYDQLLALTQQQEALHKTVVDSQKAMGKLEELVQVLNKAPKSQSIEDRIYRKGIWKGFRREIKNVLYEGLLELAKKEKTLAQTSAEAQLSLRAVSQQVAMAGAALTICFAAAITTYFLKNVTQRLNALNQNAVRLAHGVPLLDKLPGSDDIAFLDSTLHEMDAVLKESMRKERAVVENALDFICSIDKGGKITAANPASTQLLGRTPEELLGSHFADYLADERHVASQFIEDLIRLGDCNNVDMNLKRSDGTIVQTVWSAHWSKEEGVASCIVHDVSERYAAQQLRQELVAMITHDLRTPLSTMGNVFVLLSKALSGKMDKQTEGLTSLGSRQVEKMAQLVNDLLDIDKIHSGQMSIEPSKVLLEECFSACIESLTLLAEEKKIELDFTPTDLMVLGDEEKIDRVLVNLVANAIRYSPMYGKIHVFAVAKDTDAYVSVEDQGRGIPRDQFETIFERFRQVEGAASHGSGLGLAICKAFIELHKGRIWVEKSSDKGSTFTFTLPLAARS